MTRRSRTVLRAVAALFVLANLGFAALVLTWREPVHAFSHVALALLGLLAFQYLGRTRPRAALAAGATGGAGAVAPGAPAPLDARLARLEQSLDAIAVEVERVGEGQRWVTGRLVGGEGAGAAAPRAPEAERAR